MAKIDDLIQQYCPDGCEYRHLAGKHSDAVARIERGKRITKNDLKDDGEYIVMSGGTTPMGRYSAKNRNANTVTISSYGAAGYVAYITEDFWANDVCLSIYSKDTSVLNEKYMYYALKSQQNFLYANTTKAIPDHIPTEFLEKLKIPVPPLLVQEEIVQILDSFTELETELETELANELELRHKQFEFYLDEMLSFDNSVDCALMSDLFDFRNGLSKSKDSFGKGIRFIRYTDVYNNRCLSSDIVNALVDCTIQEINKLQVKRGDVFFTRTSETREDVGISSVLLEDLGVCVFNGFTIKATPKTDRLLPEYCKYCFSDKRFRKYVADNCVFTTRASLTGSTIGNYVLPIPSLDKQRHVVDVLDKYELLQHGIVETVPSEIKMRHQQYEYYRDKLLTFKEIG